MMTFKMKFERAENHGHKIVAVFRRLEEGGNVTSSRPTMTMFEVDLPFEENRALLSQSKTVLIDGTSVTIDGMVKVGEAKPMGHEVTFTIE